MLQEINTLDSIRSGFLPILAGLATSIVAPIPNAESKITDAAGNRIADYDALLTPAENNTNIPDLVINNVATGLDEVHRLGAVINGIERRFIIQTERDIAANQNYKPLQNQVFEQLAINVKHWITSRGLELSTAANDQSNQDFVQDILNDMGQPIPNDLDEFKLKFFPAILKKLDNGDRLTPLLAVPAYRNVIATALDIPAYDLTPQSFLRLLLEAEDDELNNLINYLGNPIPGIPDDVRAQILIQFEALIRISNNLHNQFKLASYYDQNLTAKPDATSAVFNSDKHKNLKKQLDTQADGTKAKALAAGATTDWLYQRYRAVEHLRQERLDTLAIELAKTPDFLTQFNAFKNTLAPRLADPDYNRVLADGAIALVRNHPEYREAEAFYDQVDVYGSQLEQIQRGGKWMVPNNQYQLSFSEFVSSWVFSTQFPYQRSPARSSLKGEQYTATFARIAADDPDLVLEWWRVRNPDGTMGEPKLGNVYSRTQNLSTRVNFTERSDPADPTRIIREMQLSDQMRAASTRINYALNHGGGTLEIDTASGKFKMPVSPAILDNKPEDVEFLLSEMSDNAKAVLLIANPLMAVGSLLTNLIGFLGYFTFAAVANTLIAVVPPLRAATGGSINWVPEHLWLYNPLQTAYSYLTQTGNNFAENQLEQALVDLWLAEKKCQGALGRTHVVDPKLIENRNRIIGSGKGKALYEKMMAEGGQLHALNEAYDKKMQELTRGLTDDQKKEQAPSLNDQVLAALEEGRAVKGDRLTTYVQLLEDAHATAPTAGAGAGAGAAAAAAAGPTVYVHPTPRI